MSSRVESYDDDKLHTFLDNLQGKISNLDQRIHKSWFHLHALSKQLKKLKLLYSFLLKMVYCHASPYDYQLTRYPYLSNF